MSNEPARIFISYSHRDEGLRDQLVAHLSLLQRQGLIATWFDRMISPGDKGDDVINANLERADIVLLLVSADFINSLYCWEKELTRSLERHEAKEAIVIPIVVRAVDLQGASIGSIQSLPTDRRPVTSWPNHDEAWADVSRGIRKAVEQVQERQRRFHQSHDIEQIGQVLGSRSQPEQFGDGIATGFASLDNLLSGLHPSDLVVIGGRPTMGKTTFAMNIALNVALLTGRPLSVGVFSMETSREALANKMMSALARVDNNELRSGRFDDLAWIRINAAIGLLKRASLYVDDTPSITPAALLARASKLKDQHGLNVVVIDHLQLMQGQAQDENRRSRDRSLIARELKEIARKLNVTVVATSQVNRRVDSRIDKRPVLSDLPDGYDLEVHADVVLFIYREEVYEPWTTRKGIADIEVAKQRNGPVGQVNLVFMPKYSTFQNLSPEHGDDST